MTKSPHSRKREKHEEPTLPVTAGPHGFLHDFGIPSLFRFFLCPPRLCGEYLATSKPFTDDRPITSRFLNSCCCSQPGTSKPLIRGIFRSRKITSGNGNTSRFENSPFPLNYSTAIAPFAAVPTIGQLESSIDNPRWRKKRSSSESSTINVFLLSISYN